MSCKVKSNSAAWLTQNIISLLLFNRNIVYATETVKCRLDLKKKHIKTLGENITRLFLSSVMSAG